ncbi:MAG TPA: hypothetical protein VHO48_04290, partial [Anaerolineaceae bacterium]|nr:hypothetical protein [Anaerolineaceae bacterium]
WEMRLWDAFLSIVPPLLLGWLALSVPAGRRAWLWKLAFSVWMFVFIAQGPIYAPLVIAAIGVVLALRLRSLALAGLLVAASAYYASICRYTWTYAPGLWAGMLALLALEKPTLHFNQWKRLLRPVILGLCGYAGGELLPDIIKWISSGGQGGAVTLMLDAGTAVSRQPLLWDRLWPNSTFAPGIMLATLWATLPVVVLLVWLVARCIWRLNVLQLLAASGVTLAFLAVGLVASVKIGGGSNLHNLDMFWLTLGMLVANALPALFPRVEGSLAVPGWATAVILSVALVFPVTYTVAYGEPLGLPPADMVQEALTKVQEQVAQAGQSGEVLFIDQRQLVTFGLVPPVPFIADYEKKYMMDKAMASDADYFEAFHSDLARQRFALIITEPVRVNYISDSERSFVEENNAWVSWVSAPLLTYYQPLETYEQVGVQILVPKK